MKPNGNVDNRIFLTALTGSLLFITAMAFILLHLSNIVMMQLSYTLVASILGMASVSLLYQAVRKDKERLKEI